MSPPSFRRRQRSVRTFAMAAAAAMISFIPPNCCSQQQSWTARDWEDNELNTFFSSEGGPRHRISTHRKLKKLEAVLGGSEASENGMIGRELERDSIPELRVDDEKQQLGDSKPQNGNYSTLTKKEKEKEKSHATVTRRDKTFPNSKAMYKDKNQIGGKRISVELELIKKEKKEQTGHRIKEEVKLTKKEKKQYGGNIAMDESSLTKKEKKEQSRNRTNGDSKLTKEEKKLQNGKTFMNMPALTKQEKKEENGKKMSDMSKMTKDEKKKYANGSHQNPDVDLSNLSKKEKKKIINSNSNSSPQEDFVKKEENSITDIEGYGNHGWWGDDFHRQNDDDDGDICICEDDDDSHRRHLVDGSSKWHEVDKSVSDADGRWGTDDVLIESFENDEQLPLSTSRTLLNLLGLLAKQPLGQINKGNLTELRHRHSKGGNNKTSKSSKSSGDKKKGKRKGGKNMKKSGKSAKHDGGWKSTKSRKSSKSSSKSSKPCVCHPTTEKPIIKSRRPTRSPRTEKPQNNILPKPTTRKPTE